MAASKLDDLENAFISQIKELKAHFGQQNELQSKKDLAIESEVESLKVLLVETENVLCLSEEKIEELSAELRLKNGEISKQAATILEKDEEISKLAALNLGKTLTVAKDKEISEHVALTVGDDGHSKHAASLLEKDKEISKLAATVMEKDKIIAKLAATVIEKDEVISKLAALNIEKDEEISKQAASNLGKDDEISRLAALIVEKDEEIAKHAEEISKHSETIICLDDEVSNLSKSLAEKNADSFNLTEEVFVKDAEISRLSEELDAMDHQLTLARNRIQNNDRRYENVRIEMSGYILKLHETKKRIQTSEEEAKRSEKMYQLVNEMVHDYRSQIEVLKERIDLQEDFNKTLLEALRIHGIQGFVLEEEPEEACGGVAEVEVVQEEEEENILQRLFPRPPLRNFPRFRPRLQPIPEGDEHACNEDNECCNDPTQDPELSAFLEAEESASNENSDELAQELPSQVQPVNDEIEAEDSGTFSEAPLNSYSSAASKIETPCPNIATRMDVGESASNEGNENRDESALEFSFLCEDLVNVEIETKDSGTFSEAPLNSNSSAVSKIDEIPARKSKNSTKRQGKKNNPKPKAKKRYSNFFSFGCI